VLEKNPGLKIQVFAVWFSMIASDTPTAFPVARKVMPDRRVTHYWDRPREVGKWFKNAVPSDYQGPIQWDAFYLYSADAVWTDKPQPQLAWGRTILQSRQRLADQIAAIARRR
jgi:hypothetical protein